MYLLSLSIRQIAKLLGVSKSYVGNYIKENKLSRPHYRGVMLRIPLPKESVNKRSSHHRARRVYENYHNVALGWNDCIHHKDENPFNNNIDNLELMTLSSHAKYHNHERKLHDKKA